MENRKKDGLIYDLLFCIYILFLIVNSYCLLMTISNPKALEMYVPPGDWDGIYPIDISSLNLFKKPFQFLTEFRIHNLIFNITILFTSNYFFAFNFTPTLILIVCLWLVYLLGTFEKNKYYGLMTVFIFSSLPITITYSKFNICHLGETFYLLLGTYLYLKSENLKNPGYTLLYAFTLIFFVLRRGSGLSYLIVLLCLSCYFIIREREKNYIVRQTVFYVAIILLLVQVLIYDSEYLRNYFTTKATVCIFSSSQLTEYMKTSAHFLFNYLFFDLPYNVYTLYLYPVYTLLFVLSFMLSVFTLKIKKQTEYEIILNWFIIIPFLSHIVTSAPPYTSLYTTHTNLDDIFPVFAFLTLRLTHNWFKTDFHAQQLRKLITHLNNKYLKRLGLAIRRILAGKHIKITVILCIFLYGTFLIIPYWGNTLPDKIAPLVGIKKVIAIPHKNQSIDTELMVIQTTLYEYIKKLQPDNKRDTIRIFSLRIYHDKINDIEYLNKEIQRYLQIHTMEGDYLDIFSKPSQEFSLSPIILKKRFFELETYHYFILIASPQEKSIPVKIFAALSHYRNINFLIKKEFTFTVNNNPLKIYLAMVKKSDETI